MMEYIVMGIVQGFTEFLPVSSSGHLVILHSLFGMQTDLIELAIVVHLGTALAVIVFFFKDILRLFRNKTMLLYVLLVTGVTGVIGIAGKAFFEPLFTSPMAVGFALLVTGFILILTKQYSGASRTEVRVSDAAILGLAQGIAIIPGISRSGSTISSLMLRGVQREESFRFSFLASIPAIFGAAILEFNDTSCWCTIADNLGAFSVAFIVSFISGMASLRILRAVMRRAQFHYFGFYCLALGLITIFFID